MEATLTKALLGIVAVISTFMGVFSRTPAVTVTSAPVAQVSEAEFAGTFNPVQAQRFFLSGSGAGINDTTITLTSLKLPDGSTNITMTNLGSIGYGTIEPGSSKEEQISFTGISQNANGTATLTGVTRGLRFVSPCDSVSANKKAHAGGSIFVLSNTSCFYSQFTIKGNNEHVDGLWNFDSPPYLNNAATSSNQAASVAFVLATAIQGAATSTENFMGISQLASAAARASGQASSTTGAPLIIPNSYATSTQQTSAGYIPSTRSDGSINPQFVGTTTSDTYRFAGPMFFNTSTTTFNATTSFSGATSTAPICINSLCSGWPTSAASSSILMTTGGTNSDITWSNSYSRRIFSTTTDVTNTGTASSTSMTFTLPANYLGATGVLHVQANYDNFGLDAGNLVFGLTGGGTNIAYASSTSAQINATTDQGVVVDFYVTAANATNAQEIYSRFGCYNVLVSCGAIHNSASTLDTTSAQTFTVTQKFGASGVQSTLTFKNGYVELIR